MDVDLLVPMLTGPSVMAVVAAICHWAAVGRIAPNHSVGIRLRSTLSSDAAWRGGHRAAVLPAVASTGVLGVGDGIAALLRSDGASVDALAVGLVVLLALAVTWVVLASARGARRSDRAT